jgi:NAD(P)-dependent dehydrogenase (short-subunit alcohol dehydrogenase family)
MPSYVIVGASRGIGYGFLEVLSKDSSNKVIGLARTPRPVQKQVDIDGLQNVTILPADLTDYESLRSAAKEISSLTDGGAVDYLWINGAYISDLTANRFFDEFSPEEYPQLIDDLQTSWSTNVVGVINTLNAFLPLVMKSSIKKVMALGSGLADDDLTVNFGIWESGPYSISKAALTTVMAKYDARYRSKGVLFLCVSPGMVDNGRSRKFSSFSFFIDADKSCFRQCQREASCQVNFTSLIPACDRRLVLKSLSITCSSLSTLVSLKRTAADSTAIWESTRLG